MPDSKASIKSEHTGGLHALLRLRLEQYGTFLTPLTAAYPGAPFLNLGQACDAWQPFMVAAGLKSSGMDVTAGTPGDGSEGCASVSVNTVDPADSLKGFAENSHGVISVFLDIDALGIERLTVMIREALRVLKPGGLLIIENRKGEAAAPGATDPPSGLRPVSEKLIRSLVDYCGFQRHCVVEFRMTKKMLRETSLSLDDLVCHLNAAKAIIAQKTADETVLKSFDTAFEGARVLPPAARMERYISELEEKVRNLEIRFREAEKRAYDVWQREISTAIRAQEAETRAHDVWLREKKANVRAQEAEQMLEAIYVSTSWRMTAPLRELSSQAGLLRQGAPARIKAIVKKLILPLAKRIIAFLKLRPGLAGKLLNLSARMGLDAFLRSRYQNLTGHLVPTADPVHRVQPPGVPLDHLTPRARSIYVDLKAAVQSKREAH